MSQLEKILEHITGEAKTEAKQIQKEALAQAEAVRDSYRQKAAAKEEEILARAKAEAERILERAKSAAALSERQLLLKTRREILQKVSEQALDTIRSLPDAAYFDLLLTLVSAYALPQAGEMRLSKEDHNRLPADFSQRLEKALSGIPGAKLSLSGAAAKTGGGFILVYGNIEENCTFSALFEEKAELLSDTARKVLFADEG